MTPLFIWLILYQYYQVNGLATEVRLAHYDSDVQLKSYEGVIEVLVNGTWGPIYPGGVDSTTAKTICKILGHGFTGFLVDRFSYDGVPLLKGLSCGGNETSIQECTQYPMSGIVGVPYVQGVHCFAQVFSDLRLTDGEGPNNGTVNIKMDGRWGLLCGTYRAKISTPTIDLVICRTLGYQGTLNPDPRYGSSLGVYLNWLDIGRLSCNGDETNLNQCNFTEGVMFQPGCDGYRGVNCITLLNESCTSDDICAAVANAVCIDNICKCRHGYLQTGMYMCTGISQMIRLDPSFGHNNESFLQVKYDGEWTYISNRIKSFSNTTAKMICQTLGFGYTGFSSWLNTYFVDETNVTSSEEMFACNGTENILEDCFTLDEYPQRLVLSGETPVTTLHCFDRWINDLRLTDGQTSYHGNLEVKFGDRWGSVCAAGFPKMAISAATESVICKSLWNAGNGGYLNATVTSNNTIPWISYLNCEATLTDINQCNYTLGPPQGTENNCHDTGFVNVRCPNCEMGFYGPKCTQCNCNIYSTHACDMFTGACNCEPGWTDETCSTDIDECSISDETCPERFVCINQPGYFICECSPGYIAYGSLCVVCNDGHYGHNCSQLCDCELKNVDLTIYKRSCDAVSGSCACKSDWTGRRCDIDSTTQPLIIIISSTISGCLLLAIIVTVCGYRYRNCATKGSDPSSPKETMETLKTGVVDRKSSHNQHNATMPSADGEDYNTINDCMVDIGINADTEYDIHPDLLKRTDRSDGIADVDDGNDSDGYLKLVATNTGTGSDTHLETDNDGYLIMDTTKRQLPGVPIDDQSKSHNPYEGLKDRRQVEHEYIKMAGNKI